MTALIILTILLSPAYIVRFAVLGFPTNVLMLWVTLVWIIWLAQLLLRNLVAEFLLFVKNFDKKILVFSLLFFLSGIISLFAHGFNGQKFGQFIVLFVQPISIFFIGGFEFYKNPGAKKYATATLYYFAGLIGLYAIYQYSTLHGLSSAFWGNNQEPKRATGIFIHPNFYALFIAPLLAFLIPDLIEKFKIQSAGWRTKFKIMAWAVGSIGLLLSLSRAGWLGLAAAVIVYVIFAADKKIKKIIFIAAAITLGIGLLVPNLRYRLLLPFYGEKSAVSRLSLWHTGILGIKESPITGLGLTGFAKNWNRLNTDPNLDTHNFPHNIFLDLWVETGILGLISLISLIALFIYRGLKLKGVEALDNKKLINLSISLFLITLLAQGQIDNPYFKNDLAMVFWIILSLG